jgi:hypothetical protein
MAREAGDQGPDPPGDAQRDPYFPAVRVPCVVDASISLFAITVDFIPMRSKLSKLCSQDQTETQFFRVTFVTFVVSSCQDQTETQCGRSFMSTT